MTEIPPQPPPDPLLPDPPLPDPVPDPLGDALTGIMERLGQIEMSGARYRQGVVTAITPALSVALGSSDVSYTSVSVLDGIVLTVGQTVAALLFGNDLIVIGGIGTTVAPRGFETGDVKTTAIATPIPAGWLLCNGQAVTAANPALRAKLLAAGSPYGLTGADPKVPDMRGRTPIGVGTGAGLTARAAGATGGAETHDLTVAEMPAHSHTGGAHTHTGGAHTHTGGAHTHTEEGVSSTVGLAAGSFAALRQETSQQTGSGGNVATSSGGNVATTSGGNVATSTDGGGGVHNNMPPFLALTYLIKT